MNYRKPEYIEDIPALWKDYFNESIFKDKPYPPTIEEANDYLLFEVFKVDKKDMITLIELDEKGNLTENVTDYTRENFHSIFNYNNWKNLSNATKITALYWLYAEICDELKIYKPHFRFLSSMREDISGCFLYETNEFIFHLSEDSNTSTYDTINTIAHELNHAWYFSRVHESVKENENINIYLEFPCVEDYDMSDDYDRFEYYYDLTLYYLQPTEMMAYNYGIKKAKQIFDETNKSKSSFTINNKSIAKVKKDTSCIDLLFFRQNNMERNHNIEFFKKVMGGDVEEQIEKNFLKSSFYMSVKKLAQQILDLDPDAEVVNDKVVSKSKDECIRKLVKEYNADLKALYEIDKEIQKDIKRLYTVYKSLAADEDIILYK